MHGALPNRTVVDMMAQASIFIQHSVIDPVTGDEEGLPVAILEAMAAALPVVSTAHAGIPELIQHGKNGFLVDPGDTQAMARWMLILAGDQGLRASIGLAARRTVSEHFNWAVERTRLLRLLGLNEVDDFREPVKARE